MSGEAKLQRGGRVRSPVPVGDFLPLSGAGRTARNRRRDRWLRTAIESPNRSSRRGSAAIGIRAHQALPERRLREGGGVPGGSQPGSASARAKRQRIAGIGGEPQGVPLCRDGRAFVRRLRQPPAALPGEGRRVGRRLA